MHKPSLLSLAILGSALAMPLAFAQDVPATNAGDTAAPVSAAATEATVEGDVVASDASAPAETDATATTGTSASATAGTSASTTAGTPATAGTNAASGGAAAAPAATQVTWADLDADNDGALSRTEATPLASLVQVFDDADADADGKLTPDEYRAFVAANDAATGGATGDDGEG